ncbi:MAG: IS66 family transposase [Candidatus Thioglobus sp.]|nr:MAG: IS66 family transposase [Candidatus Thioglobus sp.]
MPSHLFSPLPDIEATMANVKQQLEADSTVTPALKLAIEALLMVIAILANRLGLNSKNSSKPPSTDPNRDKNKKNKSDNKAGGQKGHIGSTLRQVAKPDNVEQIKLDKRTLPKGTYTEVGVIRRQVFDIEFKTVVTEYQAQILKDEHGNRYTAAFPDDVTQPVQYGAGVKAHAVYLSQYQLLPYDRVKEYFADQLQMPISAGSIFNFNAQAAQKLKDLGALDIIKSKLKGSPVLHADETGMNINGDRHWLHTASTQQWTYFFNHKRRGKEATDAAGVLPDYDGVLVHDHWKPYFNYNCLHALCNAHHVRELEFAYEKEEQNWAKKVQDFLFDTNKEVEEAGGSLKYRRLRDRIIEYRTLLNEGEQVCLAPERKPGQKGRLKKSKSRNLLERLIKYEKEVLRFMINPDVPFTNNLAENDIRMTKVHQKISGCFRSEEGAEIFCAVRSYISSCRKQGITASTALQLLFSGHLPDIFTR